MADPIYSGLQAVFVDVFGKNVPRLGPATTARDVKAWDSLSHLTLIMAIEEHFGEAFAAAEIRNFRTVGDIATLLKARGSKGISR